MSYQPLRYPEGNDRTHTVAVVIRDPVTQAETPYDLTGHVITLIRKLSKDVPDIAASNITSPGTVVEPPTDGVLTVPFTAEMLTPTGRYWYKINGVASGKTVTFAYGDLDAVNA